MTSTARTDIYNRITNQIITSLEQGVRPWTQPWRSPQGAVSRPRRHTGEPYGGVNVLALWAAALAFGYSSPVWMTFKQALAYGACVRKGEHGSSVVYASTITREGETNNDPQTIPFLKSYTVFNLAQIDGLPERFHTEEPVLTAVVERDAHLETYVAATGAQIHTGGSAWYAPSRDLIQMPPIESFPDSAAYYATLLHELTHWTKAPTRLDRDLGRRRHGDAGYAREELVAELGAAFLCADLGVTLAVREDHASYIASWLTVLRDDKRAIFEAAAHAQRAVDFLHGCSGYSPRLDNTGSDAPEAVAASEAVFTACA